MKNLRALICALALLAPAWQAHAAIAFRQLTGTYPVAVQRGTKATVTVYSNFSLDGAYAVFFDPPGIRMTLAEKKPLGGGHNGKSRAGNPFRFEVEVTADQPSQVYEYRIATPQGVSSIGLLRVTDFPVIQEITSENGTATTAQVFELPAALCGKCEKQEDVDCFRFTGKADDEVVFEIFAQRVMKGIHDMIAGTTTNYVMDPILTLFGPTGQIVAQNDNVFGGDSLLAYKLPVSGDYVLEVRDCRYNGHPKYTYCVEVAKRSFAQCSFPLAVQRARTTPAELIGPFCENSGKVELTATADAPLGWKDVRFKTARGELNPVAVLVSEHPQQSATGANQSLATATTISLPCGISGRLATDGEAHYYAFDARKDGYYLFEIESHRRGLPLDATLEVFDAAGKKVELLDPLGKKTDMADDPLMPGDDMPFTKDARLHFQAPADGRFIVCVRDLNGRGGPTFAYHLRAEPAGPDFEIKGHYYYAMLAPGTRTVWFVNVNRLNGFKGPVTMFVEGLPAGVSFEPVTIPAGMNDCSLLLTASPDAKVGASLVRVFGQAQVHGSDGKPRAIVHRGRVTCELQGEGGGQYLWPCRTQLVGVVEKLDLVKVEATPAEITLAPGGKVEIAVRVERDKDYKDPVNLDMVFIHPQPFVAVKLGMQLPPGVTLGKASKLRLADAGGVLNGKIVLEAAANALPVERLPISVLAGVNFSFTINTTYGSNPIYLTIPFHDAKPAVANAARPENAVASPSK
jgi:hypothetical protein